MASFSYSVLRGVIERMNGRPVTARTLDVGGEKIASALSQHFAEPANPALGLRAIRLGLREPKLLETQLAAMLRAGAHGPLRILLPMISSADEIRKVREKSETYQALVRAVGSAKTQWETEKAEKNLRETPWVQWEDEMAVKTAIKRMMKRIPLSGAAAIPVPRRALVRKAR